MRSLLIGITLLSSLPLSDTTVTFGVVRRDLTGDGIPETLSLVGTGPSLTDLRVTFTIQSAGKTLFSNSWPFTRPVDGPPRAAPALETRIREYGSWFFDDSKFMAPAVFVSGLEESAPLHIDLISSIIAKDVGDSGRARTIWQQMRAAPIIIFQFSSGGDEITAIGWSSTDKQFYHLLECC